MIVSVAVLAEGIVYVFFPQKIKKVIEGCPLSLFRIIGVSIIILGAVLFYLYFRILI